MTDPRDLLAAARTDATARGVLADRVREEDGDTPAAEAARAMVCEACECPEGEYVGRGSLTGRWYQLTELQVREGFDLEGHAADGTPDRIPVENIYHHPRLELCHYLGRWCLACQRCQRSLRSRQANATRRANRQAREDAAPNLFSGVDDDGA
jgi:hypothetical protein